jgi:hypothetical protein
MLRLTFTLAAALYAGFVIWGEPEGDALTAREMPTPVFATVVQTDGAFDSPTVLGSARGAEAVVTRAAVAPTPLAAPDPATIAASAPPPGSLQPRLIGEPVVVSLVAPAETAREEAAAQDLVRVTGSRVNMRSGPGTGNAVLDSLPQGTLAEPLGEPVDGWQEIRDVETGRTGFMAARFLEPA